MLWCHSGEAQLSSNRSFHLHLSMTSAPTYRHPAVGAWALYGRVRTLIASQTHTSVGFSLQTKRHIKGPFEVFLSYLTCESNIKMSRTVV